MMYDLKAMNFVATAARFALEEEEVALLSAFIWDETPEGWDYWAERIIFGNMDDESKEKVQQMLAQYDLEGATIQ